MPAIRLPDAIEQRLAVLASETGRTRTTPTGEAILPSTRSTQSQDHSARRRGACAWVGDWRIICDIQDQRIVVRVLRLGNLCEVYR